MFATDQTPWLPDRAAPSPDGATPWPGNELERRLKALGGHYHVFHPFQRAMNEGRLSQHQLQGWVINRYYYQVSIPRKDAAIVANCPDPEVRRHWVRRIVAHDGTEGGKGGIEAWIRLGEACGLSREDIVSLRHVLPGVRYAVDAYVNSAVQAPWQEAVCYSLTELFAPPIHRERASHWIEKYGWIDRGGVRYFLDHLQDEREDAQRALDLALTQFRSQEQQQRVLDVLRFKLEVRWSMLDAMYMAYVVNMPPFFNVSPQPD